jgi:hypothetical protein
VGDDAERAVGQTGPAEPAAAAGGEGLAETAAHTPADEGADERGADDDRPTRDRRVGRDEQRDQPAGERAGDQHAGHGAGGAQDESGAATAPAAQRGDQDHREHHQVHDGHGTPPRCRCMSRGRTHDSG